MRNLKSILCDKRGNTTPLTIALILALLLILCAASEFFRLAIIANGVRNALQSAVISVATENYDEAYHGLREGYSGGYWLNEEKWDENLDYGDVYEQLDALLGTEAESGYHAKIMGDSYEFRLTNLSVDVKNVDIRPENTDQNLEVTAKIKVEVPLSFGWEKLPTLSMKIVSKSAFMPKF